MLTAIIFFLLGAWLGGHSAKDQIKRLTAERDALEAQLAAGGKGKPAIAKKELPQAPDQEPKGKVIATQHTAAATVMPQPFAKPVQPLDNAIVLLYFGAFLFTAAIGLFLAFGGLDGLTRSLLVALLVVGFYAIGLMIFENSKRLKPAGLTFVGIGIVLLPFFGLALHILAFDRMYGPATWATISIFAVLMYGYAFKITRHAYVTYFLIASVLSLYESAVSVTELPVYYFGWAMALCALTLFAVGRIKNIWPELREPLRLSGSIFIPVSLLFSLAFVADHGWGQVSMTLFLGAAYYAVSAYFETRPNVRAQIAAAADSLAVAAIGVAAYAITGTPRFVSLVLLFAAGLHVGLVWWYAEQKGNAHKFMLEYATLLASAYALFGVLFVFLNATLLSVALLVCLVVHVALYLILHSGSMVAIASVVWLILPLVVGSYVMDPGLTPSQYAVVYAESAGVLFLFRWLMRHGKQGLYNLRVAYAIGLIACWLWAVVAGVGPAATASALLALVTFGLSYYEKKAEVLIPGMILLYSAVALGCVLIGNNVAEIITVNFVALSLLSYFVGMLMSDTVRSQYVRYCALVGSFAAVFAAPLAGESIMLSPLALMVAGGLGLYESALAKSQPGKELSGGVFMAAFQWMLWQQGVENLQVYAHLWAAWLAGYAVWRNSLGQKQDEESYTIFAMLTLTLPLALRSLADAGQFYGWLLIAEQIGLVLLGMLVSRPKVIQWGLTVSVLAVLYQLRELTFVVLALVGLGLIGLAVYILTKRND